MFVQLVGGVLVGVGLYAFFEKWKGTGYSLVLNAEQMILDISIIMLIVGFVMFTVSFAGCVGALRENSCLLKFVSDSFQKSSFKLLLSVIIDFCFSTLLVYYFSFLLNLVWQHLDLFFLKKSQVY